MVSKIVVAGVSLFLTFLVGLLVIRYFEEPIDVFVSPNGKYRIELYGDKERPWLPFYENSVKADVVSNGVRNRGLHIHTGDWMDSSFDLTYQKFRWHNERVLGFHGVGNHEPVASDFGDSLTLLNNTAKRIAYLNVTFGVNRFLVFDLEPGENQELFVVHGMHHQYIYVAGEFENGLHVKGAGLNFTEKAKKQRKGLFRYCATVVGESVVVNGIGIDGTSSSPKEIIVPAVSECGE